MTALSILIEYQSSTNKVPVHANEDAWHKSWDELITTDLTPSLIALKGGLYSTMPTGIFISGYQAAVRSVFPEVPKTGWSAFAASEDQADPISHPPMRLLTENGIVKLNGTKSWVAQSRCVDYLVITALSESDKTVAVIVNRHQSGITMTHREKPGFLPAMSQGFAKLDNIIVNQSAILEGDRRKQFVKSESKFIMLACAAWLFAQTPSENHDLSNKLKELVLQLTTVCDNPEHTVAELAIQDSLLQESLLIFEQSNPQVNNVDWKDDRKIFTIYSQAIQNRAAKKPAPSRA